MGVSSILSFLVETLLVATANVSSPFEYQQRKTSNLIMDESDYTSVTTCRIAPLTLEERQQMRLMRQKGIKGTMKLASPNGTTGGDTTDARIASLLSKNEDELLNFVAKVNKIYHEKLNKDAPFMTFVLCGMQSAGKSTIMERFLGAVLNIVKEGTGTRCPLNTTCIHDGSCEIPKCRLIGKELNGGGDSLRVNQVFELITNHNERLRKEDRFSTEPLLLEYRASNVQNMRFVDTPGIICNVSTGADNREEIKHILKSEMKRPNTKLCVLLEPKEYDTNGIVDFCDQTLGGREKWLSTAICLMTKFDKQFGDSRSASKTNAFFKDYHENGFFPYLVYTPNLAKEALEPDILFKARESNLETADSEEGAQFEKWEDVHKKYRDENDGDDDDLNPKVKSRIGFPRAKKEMREIMLRDTADRIPEVIRELRSELAECQEESFELKQNLKLSDPIHLQGMVSNMVHQLEQHILDYLNGDLNSAMKLPDKLQTLEEEVQEEEESEWSNRYLNHYTEKEHEWRDKIARLEEYPDSIQPNAKFLGGKQYQRALSLFHAVMVETLPDPFALRQYAPNGTGYLNGGLQQEDWGRTTCQITKKCVKEITHPGINYLVKHTGYILRRLFDVALQDIKHGEELSAMFKLIPTQVEVFLKKEYDDMLWKLMESAAELTNILTEAKYSTVNPYLPSFRPMKPSRSSVDGTEQENDAGFMEYLAKRFRTVTGTNEAKSILREDSKDRATRKKSFLSEERTAMVTDNEITEIIQTAFQYIVALMDHILLDYTFQMNHSLYEAFKRGLSGTFKHALASAEWNTWCKPDEHAVSQLRVTEEKIKALNESLNEVNALIGRT